MAKAKKENKVVKLTTEDLERISRKQKIRESIDGDLRTFDITEAHISDDFCNYFYKIIRGVGTGDGHKVTGTGIVEDDLRKAFKKFNVHLALIECAFLHSNIEVDDIDKFHDHALTDLFNVTGFKISGSVENEKILLVGTKYSSIAGGYLEIKTHKIALDNLGGYTWYNELKAAADDARQEVALYKGGYYTAVEEDPEEEDPAQLSLELSGGGSDDDFEKAKM